MSPLLDCAIRLKWVCVVRLDRLGRSLKELLETVDELRDRQVNLISLEEKIDTTSAAGELIFHRNYRPPRFAFLPDLYPQRHPRVPHLDLPFHRDDVVGVSWD